MALIRNLVYASSIAYFSFLVVSCTRAGVLPFLSTVEYAVPGSLLRVCTQHVMIKGEYEFMNK